MKITKKLRDVTKKELKEWYRIKCDNHCVGCIFDNVYCCIVDSNHQWVNHKDLYSDKFLDQTIEIEIPDILDAKEKEYLSAVIKPFRNKVKYIKKRYVWEKVAIEIATYTSFNDAGIADGYETNCLPRFGEKSQMYQNMEIEKEYTLKELGL